MPVECVFLDWKLPLLPQAVAWAVKRSARPDSLDLRGLTIVLPGGRAIRRFVELLVEQSETLGRPLLLPELVTSGQLPELLYESSSRPATTFERAMAWVQACAGFEPEELSIVFPKPPPQENLAAWFKIGRTLDSLYADIAAGGLDFDDVAEHCASSNAVHLDERWQVLAEIFSRFSADLKRRGLGDIHAQRKSAAKKPTWACDRTLVLVGTSDLAPMSRMLMERVSTGATALVHAPSEMARGFDSFGCIVPEFWLDKEIPLDDSSLHFVRGPSEQALRTASLLAESARDLPPEQVTIAACAHDARPYLIEALEERGVLAHNAGGLAIENTPPYIFLARVADYLRTRSYSSFANLVRHPHVHELLLRSPSLSGIHSKGRSLLGLLDDYQSNHLQAELTDHPPGAKDFGNVPVLARTILHAALGDLLKPPRPLADWADPIVSALISVFGASSLDLRREEDSLIFQACEAAHEEISHVYAFTPGKEVSISASEAIRLVLSQLAGKALESDTSEAAVDVLGWLEVQLDDAQFTIVTNFNEGSVPENLDADPFLPNALRSELKIPDSDRRFARDAYVLRATIESHPRCKIIATRLDSRGSPLNPSRLLLQCSGEVAAQRLQRFYRSTAEASQPQQTLDEQSTIALPEKPVALAEPPSVMSVTSFRDYLTCPYRFYLKHILGLRSIDDQVLELDSAASGTLIHDVLSAFGKSAVRRETSEAVIADFLLDTLAQTFASHFGPSALAPLQVQRLQAQERLKAFAHWQGRWAEQGWEIREAEFDVSPEQAHLSLGSGTQMGLRARIDRIDFHPLRKEWFVFDYKTGDRGDGPDKSHRRSGEWTNLQLPLYLHVLRELQFEGALRLGYICLPANLDATAEVAAEWTAEEIENALARAREVALLVQQQVFWPPRKLLSNMFDDFHLVIAEDFRSLDGERV